MNPDFFMFDHEAIEQGVELKVAFRLPFRDIDHLDAAAIESRGEAGYALEFSHSLYAQIDGQLKAGVQLADFYEDR